MDKKQRNSNLSFNTKENDTFVYPGRNDRKNFSSNNSFNPDFVSSNELYCKNSNIINCDNNIEIYRKVKKAKHYAKTNKGSIFRITAASGILVLFTLAIAFFSGVFGADQNSSRFTEYDTFLWPVVMQDPLPFNEEKPPSDEVILNASVWMAAFSKKINNEDVDIDGRVIISMDELDDACNNLFGKEFNFERSNIIPGKTFYEYNSEENKFYVDCVSYDQCYMPNTVNVVDLGESIILKVGYIKIDKNEGIIIDRKDESNIDKYMDYILKINPRTGQFYISEIKESSK